MATMYQQNPLRSVADYEQEMGAVDIQKGLLARNALAMRESEMGMAEKQRALQEQEGVRNALAAAGAKTPQERMDVMERTHTPTGYAQADALRKSLGQWEKDAAAAEKDRADAVAKGQDSRYKSLQQALQGLPAVANDPDAIASLAVRSGLVPFKDVVEYRAGIPTDPVKRAEWVDLQMRQGIELAKQFELKGQADTRKETARHNTSTEKNAAGQLAVSQGNLGVARERLAHDKTGESGGKPPSGYRWAPGGMLEAIPGGPADGKTDKPLAGAVVKQITEARDSAATLDRLSTSFKDDYAGKGLLGYGADFQLATSGNIGADKDAVDWWKNYRKQAELIERHSLFGAALTPTEQASWRSADIGPGMDKDVIRKNLAERTRLAKQVLSSAKQDMIDAGHSERRVSAIADRTAPKAADAPTVVRTGTSNGRKVQEMSDGSVRYAD